jgi:hypothetical protein
MQSSISLRDNIEAVKQDFTQVKAEKVYEQLIKLQNDADLVERDEKAYVTLLDTTTKKIDEARKKNLELTGGRDKVRANYGQLVTDLTTILQSLTALDGDVAQQQQVIALTVGQIDAKKIEAQRLLALETANVKSIENSKTLLVTATEDLDDAIASSSEVVLAAANKMLEVSGSRDAVQLQLLSLRSEFEAAKKEIADVQVPRLLGPEGLQGIVDAKKLEITTQAEKAIADAITSIKQISAPEVVAEATKNRIIPLLESNREEVVKQIEDRIVQNAGAAAEILDQRVKDAVATIAGVPPAALQTIEAAKSAALVEFDSRIAQVQQQINQREAQAQAQIEASVAQQVQTLNSTGNEALASLTQTSNAIVGRVREITASTEQELRENLRRIEAGGAQPLAEARLSNFLQEEVNAASREATSTSFVRAFDEMLADSVSSNPVVANYLAVGIKNLWVSVVSILNYVATDTPPTSEENNQQIALIKQIQQESAIVSYYNARQRILQFVLVDIPDRLFAYQAVVTKYLSKKDTSDALRNSARDVLVESLRTDALQMTEALKNLQKIRTPIIQNNLDVSQDNANTILQFYSAANQFSDDLQFAQRVVLASYEIEEGAKPLNVIDFTFIDRIVEIRKEIVPLIEKFQSIANKAVAKTQRSIGNSVGNVNFFIAWQPRGDLSAQEAGEKSLVSFYGNLFLLFKYVREVYSTVFLRPKNAEDASTIRDIIEFQDNIRKTVADLEDVYIEKNQYFSDLFDMYNKAEVLMTLVNANISKRPASTLGKRGVEGVPPVVEEPEGGTSEQSTKKPRETRKIVLRQQQQQQQQTSPMIINGESINEDELRLVFDRALTMYFAERAAASNAKVNGDEQ